MRRGGEGRKGRRRGEIPKMSRVWPGLRRKGDGSCSLAPTLETDWSLKQYHCRLVKDLQ